MNESFDWQHGVFIGATVSSEQTAAAEGTVGALRRDPFAMLPFCGYNMADYWGHWLDVGKATVPDKLPRIFQVNWFRKDSDGRFLWPGFGENSRVVEWVIRRIEGKADAVKTPLGLQPSPGALNLTGLGLDRPAGGRAVRRERGQLAGRGGPDRGVLPEVRRRTCLRRSPTSWTSCAPACPTPDRRTFADVSRGARGNGRRPAG